jgi:hypothetical protein
MLLLVMLWQRRALHRMMLWRRGHVSYRLSRKLGRRWLWR